MSKTIVFVHGVWMPPLCWEKMLGYFEGKGYTCLAPAWPQKDVPIEQLHKQALAGLGVTEIVDHYERVIRGLNEPPSASTFAAQPARRCSSPLAWKIRLFRLRWSGPTSRSIAARPREPISRHFPARSTGSSPTLDGKTWRAPSRAGYRKSSRKKASIKQVA